MDDRCRLSVRGLLDFDVSELSLDYAALIRSLIPSLNARAVGAALLASLAVHYESMHGACALHEFEQSGAVYLFDMASSAVLRQEDRTVAA
jgi:hypothetical protein